MSQETVNVYEAVIADLEAKIAAMQSMIKNLREMAAPTLTSAFAPAPLNSGAAFSHDAFFGMTVADAAKKYLSAIKKTATLSAISEALVGGGLKTSAKNIPENIRTILSRTPDFVRINGEFGLAEWYPGRKASPKRPAITSYNPIEDVSETMPGHGGPNADQ